MKDLLRRFSKAFTWAYHRYKPRSHKEIYSRIHEHGDVRISSKPGADPLLLSFFALGDFGVPTASVRQTAHAMNMWAQQHGNPDFILGLGDHFYPHGVSDVADTHFQKTWRDVFLIHTSLRVPWRTILGNHDYMSNPLAQIEYTSDKMQNSDQLWFMPSKSYHFRYKVEPHTDQPQEPPYPSVASPARAVNIDFYGMDTNGAQLHVARMFPQLPSTLSGFIDQLRVKLAGSSADWKIVFGHHPMHTQGRGHGRSAKSLRYESLEEESSSSSISDSGRDAANFEQSRSTVQDHHRAHSNSPVHKHQQPQPQHQHQHHQLLARDHRYFGLEGVLRRGGVQAYFCGHEHVFQHHHTGGLHHFGCGASGAETRPGSGLYGGVDPTSVLDWVCTGEQAGFLSVRVYAETMVVSYVRNDGGVLREVTVHRQPQEPPPVPVPVPAVPVPR